MSKNLEKEYLEDLDHYDEGMGIHSTSYEKCKERLIRLARIDNSNPSEALEWLEQFLNEMTRCLENPKEYVKGYEKQIFWKYKNTLETTIKQALLELQSLKEAKPSEALECLEMINPHLETELDKGIWNKQHNTIKQALLKTEKEHNSTNLLMQELDCKDFADLRKYARCGYEKLNKKYLKWEDLEFTRDEKVKLVKMGDTVYKVLYRCCDGDKEVQLLSEDEKLLCLNLIGKYKDNIQLFNDLRLERVEE